MQSPHRRHDVIVVGARAAGAATALLLARYGHDVALLDRNTLPTDTLSTHQIARPGVVQLHRWGLLQAVLNSGAPAIRQITFTAAGESVTRTLKHSAGVDVLVAPRRHILDPLVAEAAARAGADLRPGFVVDGVHLNDAGRAVGVYGHDRTGAPVDLAARFVVGADGLRSRVARAVGAEIIEDRGAPGAAQYAYFAGLPWPGIELIVGDRALTGVFPTHHGQACVWICSPTADAHEARRHAASREDAFTAYLHRTAPELAARLRTGRRTSPVTGMLRTPNYLRRCHGPGWALVGDAGYHRDAVTGHGLSDAYRDAELLATALHRALRGDLDSDTALAGYQRQRDRALRKVFARRRMTRRCARPAHARRRTEMTATVNESSRNGVDTATLFATLDAVKAAPEAAKFQFHARNQWLSGTHSRSTIHGFYGVGEERAHERTFHFDADHPAVLVGRDNGPTPVEYVLHALAACLTAGLANIAAARGIRLTEVHSTVSGDIDLNGILGLNPDVRNGYQNITVRFTIKGDASTEKLRELVEQSRARSAVLDVITNQVPVSIEVETE